MIAKGLLWSVVLLMLMVVTSVYAWTILPDGAQFPVHWDVDGEANRYASKLETVVAIPLLAAVLIIAFSIAPVLDPRRANLEKSRSLYLTGWIGGIGILAMAHGAILYTAFTQQMPSVRWILALNGVFLILLGNVIAKSRSNWFAGIRTPWTLSSEHAWSVANRLAGWGFVVTGGASILAVFFFELEKALMVLLVGVGASVLVSVFASYLAWRTDPDRASSKG